MSVVKRIVCLANSRKLSGRCVAGKELVASAVGGWLRPVSAREDGAVSEYERRYQDGTDPRVLDIIDVPLLEAHPKDYQQENWRLDPQFYWVRSGAVAWENLRALVDPVGALWVNGHKTYNGRNDCIPLVEASALTSSLKLVQVPGVTLRVFAPQAAFGNAKRRVQAQFAYGGEQYALWVTDPRYEDHFLGQPDGTYQIGGCYLTISLGEPFNGSVYKLVATIIEGPAGAIP